MASKPIDAIRQVVGDDHARGRRVADVDDKEEEPRPVADPDRQAVARRLTDERQLTGHQVRPGGDRENPLLLRRRGRRCARGPARLRTDRWAGRDARLRTRLRTHRRTRLYGRLRRASRAIARIDRRLADQHRRRQTLGLRTVGRHYLPLLDRTAQTRPGGIDSIGDVRQRQSEQHDHAERPTEPAQSMSHGRHAPSRATPGPLIAIPHDGHGDNAPRLGAWSRGARRTSTGGRDWFCGLLDRIHLKAGF